MTRSLLRTCKSHYEILAPPGAGAGPSSSPDTRLTREVAIKVLLAALAQDPDCMNRFAVEAKVTGALDHPNILAVHDIGNHEDAPCIVAEPPRRQRTARIAEAACRAGAQAADRMSDAAGCKVIGPSQQTAKVLKGRSSEKTSKKRGPGDGA